MRRIYATVAMVATVVSGSATGARAGDGGTITRPYDHTFVKYWRSQLIFQDAGTDIFTWTCIGVKDEHYYFTVYNQPTIVSPPKEVFTKDYICDPKTKITESIKLDYGAYMMEYGKSAGVDGVRIKGTITYAKQT